MQFDLIKAKLSLLLSRSQSIDYSLNFSKQKIRKIFVERNFRHEITFFDSDH